MRKTLNYEHEKLNYEPKLFFMLTILSRLASLVGEMTLDCEQRDSGKNSSVGGTLKWQK